MGWKKIGNVYQKTDDDGKFNALAGGFLWTVMIWLVLKGCSTL